MLEVCIQGTLCPRYNFLSAFRFPVFLYLPCVCHQTQPCKSSGSVFRLPRAARSLASARSGFPARDQLMPCSQLAPDLAGRATGGLGWVELGPAPTSLLLRSPKPKPRESPKVRVCGQCQAPSSSRWPSGVSHCTWCSSSQRLRRSTSRLRRSASQIQGGLEVAQLRQRPGLVFISTHATVAGVIHRMNRLTVLRQHLPSGATHGLAHR